MICIISGTNRENSYTHSVASHIYKIIKDSTEEEVKLLDLCVLNGHMMVQAPMYYATHQGEIIRTIQKEYILAADSFIFVVPEYNGSISGILKFFIDAVSVNYYKENFSGKDAFLVGVSSGRAGNLRGLDHLTGILQYLDVIVCPYKLPISIITKVYDKDTEKFIDDDTEANLEAQVLKYVRESALRYGR